MSIKVHNLANGLMGFDLFQKKEAVPLANVSEEIDFWHRWNEAIQMGLEQ